MKQPNSNNIVIDTYTDGDIGNQYSANYTQSPGDPDVTNSWGAYKKGSGWITQKVFTGKAVREWIQNKISTIQDLLNTKLNKSDYTISIAEQEDIQPTSGQRFVQKNATVTINTGLDHSVSFNTIILKEAAAITYPKVYFGNIATAIEAPITAEKITAELTLYNTANSYSEVSTALNYFYIAIPNGKTFTMITSNAEPIHTDFEKVGEDIQIGTDTYQLYCLDQNGLPLNRVTSTITIIND